eukprot:TRINITY_DN677_c0_g1_i15.p1 TRINITY_DN677_c0_g1~~TRINITY_DN677_c0_g1_i15.p1  ORF type:complete len:329 (-),score=146.93 TRINITY_DN677_c0_g1_i15:67-1053(-)
MNVFLFLVGEMKDEGVQGKLLGDMTTFLMQQKTKTLLQLKILSNMFSTFRKSVHGLSLFQSLVGYGTRINQIRSVLAQFKTVNEFERWLDGLELSAKDRMGFLLCATNALHQVVPLTALQFFISTLRFYTALGDDDKATVSGEEMTQAAKDAAILAIRLPDALKFSLLLSTSPVQGLKTSDAELFELLSVFVSGTYTDFVAFLNANDGVLSSLSLDKEALTRKIKLLTIATVASSSGMGEKIAYTSLVDALGLDDVQEVEQWVIDAIQAKIIDARLDQSSQSVIVRQVVQRDAVDWDLLDQRLTAWTNNVANILETLKKARTVEEIAQ